MPNDTFYDMWSGDIINYKRQSMIIDIQSIRDIPMFIRAGHIVPIQNITTINNQSSKREDKVLNTVDLTNTVPISLMVALDQQYYAEGTLIVDNGVSNVSLSLYN